MPRKPSPASPRGRTIALSQERILRCAIRLADEEGLEAVSMRSIAAKLGVEAMSLYNHVGGKDEVVSGIVELVLSEVDVPVNTADWKASMRRRANSVHEVLLRHPWAAALIESHGGTGDVRLGYADSVLGVLRKAGFTVQQAYEAFLTLDSFIYGFVLQEVNWPHSAQELPDAVAALGPRVPAGRFPHVVEVMSFVARKRDRSTRGYEREFAFGLELILTGLEGVLTGGAR